MPLSLRCLYAFTYLGVVVVVLPPWLREDGSRVFALWPWVVNQRRWRLDWTCWGVELCVVALGLLVAFALRSRR